MKNIHILPTTEPSRLYFHKNKLYLDNKCEKSKDKDCVNQHIDITNDSKKIILTTNSKLIADGVQAIDDEFLEWFINNGSCEFVETKVGFIQTPDNLKDGFYYKIIIPKEEAKQFVECKCTNSLQAENCIKNCGHGEEAKQDFEIISVKRLSDGEIFNVLEKVNFQGTGCSGKHLISKFVITDKKTINVNGCVVEFPLKYIQKLSKQETLEEAAEKYGDIHMEKFDLTNTNHLPYFHNDRNKIEAAFESGAKWQAERMYEIMNKYTDDVMGGCNLRAKEWFEQFKKK